MGSRYKVTWLEPPVNNGALTEVFLWVWFTACARLPPDFPPLSGKKRISMFRGINKQVRENGMLD
jgi:hypothetical protein